MAKLDVETLSRILQVILFEFMIIGNSGYLKMGELIGLIQRPEILWSSSNSVDHSFS